ncbi:hypothetical protein TUE45_02100 [Streptomyces reticuli]|nr:hypothetical protein TUE45_02100 [Streptomyces reticuli]
MAAWNAPGPRMHSHGDRWETSRARQGRAVARASERAARVTEERVPEAGGKKSRARQGRAVARASERAARVTEERVPEAGGKKSRARQGRAVARASEKATRVTEDQPRRPVKDEPRASGKDSRTGVGKSHAGHGRPATEIGETRAARVRGGQPHGRRRGAARVVGRTGPGGRWEEEPRGQGENCRAGLCRHPGQPAVEQAEQPLVVHRQQSATADGEVLGPCGGSGVGGGVGGCRRKMGLRVVTGRPWARCFL